MSDVLNPYSFRDRPTMTAAQAAGRAGVDLERALRLWRALGFPEIGDEDVLFDDADVEALRAAVELVEQGIPYEDLVGVARAYGRSLAAVADAETRIFARNIVKPLLRAGATVDEVEQRLQPLVAWLLDSSRDLLDYAHRRHLSIALQALALGEDERFTETMSVAFVDLVDFSHIADEVDPRALGELVQRFEDVALNVSAARGVRLVKVLGDGVFLVARDPERLFAAVEAIVQEVHDDARLPQARAGAAVGEVVAVAGDYVGHPVNVAARVTTFARAGTVVVTEEFLDGLHRASLSVSRIGTEKLKGVGRVRLFKVRSAPEPGGGAHPAS